MENNRLHILYTEEEGGDFRYIAKPTDAETVELFEEAIKTGRLLYSIGDRIVNIRPTYVALGEIFDGYDFIIKKRRAGLKPLPKEVGNVQ